MLVWLVWFIIGAAFGFALAALLAANGRDGDE